MLASGTLLAGRYRIEALCGVGGMGMVYRARDEQLDLDVALKVMRPEWSAERQMLERFRRELVLARQVSHRNVVRIHDIGAEGELLFLTMDFIDGRPLSELLAAEGPLPPARVARIGHQLAEALAAAHDEGVIHRDLKPANILVTADDRAFITDFGIARSAATTGLTVAGQVVGTPDYLSPEQARGSEVDGRSDIYALGLIIYRMLTGELPFPGGSYEEVIAQHTTGHARDIARTGIRVPRWLRDVVRRCLARDPDDRYPDAHRLAADLGRARAARFLPRRVLHATAAAAVLVLALGAGYLAWTERQARVPEPQAAAPVAAPVHSVAVLPPRAEGGTEPWVTAGLAESLALALAESPDLKLAEPARVARTLADLKLDPAALSAADARRIAELLDVDRMITGSIIGKGATFRIRLELASPLASAASRTFVAEIGGEDEWFAAVDRLAASLREALTARPVAAGSARLTDSLAALERYTEGVQALHRGDSLAAAPLLEDAVAEDGDFIAAWVKLADAYAALGRDRDALDAARTAVERLGDTAGRIAFEARARHAQLAGEPARAETYLRELVAAYPHDVETRAELAEVVGDAGRFDEAIEQLRVVTVRDANHPRAWYLLGKFSILNGDSRRAVDEYLVRALVIQNTLDNDQGRADVLNALGIAHHQLGDLEQARDHYRRAAELRERIGDERGVVAALSNLARVQLVEGNYDGARTQLEEALAKLDALGDRAGVANMHNEIGILEEERGDYAAALARYREALRLREALGDARALAESYNNVGYAYYLLGEYDNASVYAGQALAAYRAADNPDGAMLAQQTIGLLEIARGNWNTATRALLDALEAAREIDFPHAIAVSRGYLGNVAHLQGRYRAAAEAYTEALGILEELGDPRGVAEFALRLAELELELGQAESAGERLALAAGALEAAPNPEHAARLGALRARRQLLLGDAAAALAAAEAALGAAREDGNALAELRVASEYVAALLAAGRYDVALAAAADFRERADALGHAALQLRFRELEIEAALELDDAMRVRGRVAEARRLLDRTGDYAHAWRVHRLAARAVDNAAGDALARAAAELARVRGNMSELQRVAFDALHAGETLFADNGSGKPHD